MAEQTSKFTPINVIIWCCVAVFIAVTVVVILNLIGFEVGKPEHQEKLFYLMLIEVVAIGVAVFGKSLGIKQANKATQEAET